MHLNLAYRWFCRLDLADRIPDHSTFSKNRHGRFRESELLRHLLEKTVARCIEEGLASGQRMAVDASLIEADANKQNSTQKEEWDASTIDIADARKIILGAVWPSEAEAVESDDAFEVGEEYFDLLSGVAGCDIGVGRRNIPCILARVFMFGSGDLSGRVVGRASRLQPTRRAILLWTERDR